MTSPEGLAVLALLKSLLDHGRDYLGMFLPFVLDTIACRPDDVFTAEELSNELRVRHHLDVPPDPLRVLLKRARKQDFVRREGGRYVRTRKRPAEGLQSRIQDAQREQRNVASRLVTFAGLSGYQFSDRDSALAALMTFIESTHIGLILSEGEPSTLAEYGFNNAEEPRTSEQKAVAKFVLHAMDEEPEVTAYLQRLVQGYVLQRAITLRDLASVSPRFRDVEVYLDTPIVLPLLGIASRPDVKRVGESIQLLIACGAKVAVFEKTVDEVRRILRVYEERLATANGIRSLRETPLTDYVLSNRLRPSDVRQMSVLIEQNLRKARIPIREFPSHRNDYTLDESELHGRLRSGRADRDGARIDHDVGAVAAIATLRRGRSPVSVEESIAIFSSTSARTIETVIRWYRDTERGGVPPIIHHGALVNLAWIRNPGAVADLPTHELAAACFAALRPSPSVWENFKESLRKLEAEGEITSDESVALLVDDLVRNQLGEIPDEDSDSESIAEVIRRVKNVYRAEGRMEATRLHDKLDSERAAAQAQIELERSQTLVAARTASDSERKREMSDLYVRNRCSLTARRLASATFYLMSVAVSIIFLIGLPVLLPEGWAPAKPVTVVVTVIVFALSVASVVFGWTLLRFRRWLEAWFSAILKKHFLG